MKELHQEAMHTIESLTEFEIDKSSLKKLRKALPLLAQAYTMYEIITEMLDVNKHKHTHSIKDINAIIDSIEKGN